MGFVRFVVKIFSRLRRRANWVMEKLTYPIALAILRAAALYRRDHRPAHLRGCQGVGGVAGVSATPSSGYPRKMVSSAGKAWRSLSCAGHQISGERKTGA